MRYPVSFPVPLCPGLRLGTLLVCLLWLLGGPVPTAHAQAWTLPRGQLYLKGTFGSVTAAEQYTFDGRTTDFISGLEGNTFRDRSFYFYGEAGLADNLTLVVSLPYKRTFIEDQAFRYRTFAPGTASVGVRMGLLPLLGARPSNNALAVNVGLNLPMGYTRNFTPSVGAGQVDAQAMLHYGRSFYPNPVYAQAGVGYLYRSTVYALSSAVDCQEGQDLDCIGDRKPRFGDELLYSVEAGVTPLGGGLLLQVLANGTWSVEEPNVGFTALNPIPTRQRYLKVGGGVAVFPFRLLKTSGPLETLHASVQYLVTPDGRNTIRSQDLFFGLAVQLP
jgi:hypothetical protein